MHVEYEFRSELESGNYGLLNPPEGFEVIESFHRCRLRAEIAFADRPGEIFEVFACEKRFYDEQFMRVGRQPVNADRRYRLEARDGVANREPEF